MSLLNSPLPFHEEEVLISATTLTWDDGEGNEVIVETDEQLAIALDDLPGPTYKFKAHILDKDIGDDHWRWIDNK